MEHRVELEYLTPAEAAEVLAGIAEQIAAGTLAAGGTELRIRGPVALAIELDASHTAARATISLQCHRPDGASRLLQEELARPGG